jgi:2-succinyl-6-hydroxy-2,4-cyclohexadiene-1-carboxylate synthase
VSDGGAVVLVHGFLGGPEDFEPLRRGLPGLDFRAVDLLRFEGRDVASLAAELAEFAREARARAIVGYSLGGRIAMALAASGRETGMTFVAVSAHPGLEEPAERDRRAADDDRLADLLRRDGLEPFVERWYAQPLFATLREHPDLPLIRDRRRRGDPAAWADLLAGCSPGRTAPAWDALPGLGRRLVAIAGEQDAKYRELAGEIGRRAPRSRIHVIPGAGHAVHLERPEALAAVLGPILKP